MCRNFAIAEHPENVNMVNTVIESDDIWKHTKTCSCNLDTDLEALAYFDSQVLIALHEWIKSGRYTDFVIHPM